jgi:hypothetical protein
MKISKALLGAAAALGLAMASPALAAPRPYGGPAYYPATNNAFRLQVGGSTLSSPGIYCPSGNAGVCFDTSPFAWQALLLGGDLDLGLGRGPLSLTLGARELAAPYYTGNPSIFEPTAGLTLKLLRHTQVEPRLLVGVGLLVGNDGNAGATLRLGGGLSLFANAPIGLALDLVLEVGAFGGYEVSQVQLAVGPEFHF